MPPKKKKKQVKKVVDRSGKLVAPKPKQVNAEEAGFFSRLFFGSGSVKNKPAKKKK